jgi:hypothetical protein
MLLIVKSQDKILYNQITEILAEAWNPNEPKKY